VKIGNGTGGFAGVHRYPPPTSTPAGHCRYGQLRLSKVQMESDVSRPDRSDSCGRTRHRSETRPRSGRSVFDLSVSGRPWVLEVVGGWENTQKKNRGGKGALRGLKSARNWRAKTRPRVGTLSPNRISTPHAGVGVGSGARSFVSHREQSDRRE
jgi:hypothetical protein